MTYANDVKKEKVELSIDLLIDKVEIPNEEQDIIYELCGYTYTKEVDGPNGPEKEYHYVLKEVGSYQECLDSYIKDVLG